MESVIRLSPGSLYTAGTQFEDQGHVQENQQALDRFLASVEKQASRMAQISTRNADDALDIVQDAMIKLVEKYGDKPEAEWRPLFFAILNSRITDFHRKQTLTGRIFSWVGVGDDDEDMEIGTTFEGPEEKLLESMTIERLQAALEALPMRQQQVFLLRNWQGFSVAETAGILKLSEGSVKTHMSRATDALMRAIAPEGDK